MGHKIKITISYGETRPDENDEKLEVFKPHISAVGEIVGLEFNDLKKDDVLNLMILKTVSRFSASMGNWEEVLKNSNVEIIHVSGDKETNENIP